MKTFLKVLLGVFIGIALCMAVVVFTMRSAVVFTATQVYNTITESIETESIETESIETENVESENVLIENHID